MLCNEPARFLCVYTQKLENVLTLDVNTNLIDCFTSDTNVDVDRADCEGDFHEARQLGTVKPVL